MKFLSEFLGSAERAGQFSGSSVWAFFAIAQAIYLLYDRYQQRKSMAAALEASMKRVEAEIVMSTALKDGFERFIQQITKQMERVENEIRFKLEASNDSKTKEMDSTGKQSQAETTKST